MITIDISQAMAEIGALIARTANPEPLLASIGVHAVTEFSKRVQHTKESPDGDPWAPWAPSTAQQRSRKGNAEQGLLWDTGALLASMRYEVDAFGVTIGTDRDYAPFLQYGTRQMPARPFLGWGEGDVTVLEVLAMQYLAIGI